MKKSYRPLRVTHNYLTIKPSGVKKKKKTSKDNHGVAKTQHVK